MSTYCISDIHGNLDMFKAMLKRINFKYNGEDNLYILGDMVDWGKDSLSTLLYCKELDEQYEFVYVLIGNHEFMMLECLTTCSIQDSESKEYYDFDIELYRKTDWALNRSLETFTQFLLLDIKKQNELIKYLKNLKFFIEIDVAGKKYYLTHSDCKSKNMSAEEIMFFNTKEKFMIWNRVPLGVNRLVDVYGDEYKNVTLVHGHTIVDYYGSIDELGNPQIMFDDVGKSICIDCGCKGVGYTFFNHKCNSSLGCIRLDDLKTFYIREN